MLLTAKMAHVILGALCLTYEEGMSSVDSRAFDHCQDMVETEQALVNLLYQNYPDIVKNECYAHLPQVRKALA